VTEHRKPNIRKPANAIKQLRKAGHKVYVKHFRARTTLRKLITNEARSQVQKFLDGANLPKDVFDHEFTLGRGGKTRVTIQTEDGREFVGETKVHEADMYNRREGIGFALERALEKMAQSKKEQKEQNDSQGRN
jgi:hypothetical protein